MGYGHPRFRNHKTIYILSLLLGAVGFISTLFLADKYLLFISYLLIGCAWAAMLALPFTILTNSLKGDNIGAYLGLFNGTICLPQIVAAALGGAVLHLLGGNQSYMLVAAGVLLALGAVAVLFIRETYGEAPTTDLKKISNKPKPTFITLKPSIPKGTRDFGPLEMSRRNYIFDTIREVFRLYGFAPIETPRWKLSRPSWASMEEGDKLLFKVLNSGDFIRNIDNDLLEDHDCARLGARICEKGLRYDLTVPFARYVVMHRDELQMPFKRYQIQPVWRADRPQKAATASFISVMPMWWAPTHLSTKWSCSGWPMRCLPGSASGWPSSSTTARCLPE